MGTGRVVRSARQWAISLARPWRPVAVLGDEHARVAADPGQRQDEPRMVQRCYVGGGQADQVGGTWPSARRVRRTDSHAGPAAIGAGPGRGALRGSAVIAVSTRSWKAASSPGAIAASTSP